ncbi:unnamed protein product [Oncorhynchus mykiss]|uniref:Dynein heavy chain tail domain-containing protein n=1 Tax=Oncorhynchus mykiss TaxID=8022 RepID=A0A060XYI5_ONCMY|nr:unnamed protein product [Oncorhynchus mykiss]
MHVNNWWCCFSVVFPVWKSVRLCCQRGRHLQRCQVLSNESRTRGSPACWHHHVKEQLSDSDWTVDSVHPILDLLGYIRTDRLILAKFTEARSELLILSGYIGALLAIRRQYSSIVPALYEYTSQLMKRREVSVPLQIEQLSVELEAWMACTQSLIK